MLRGARVSTASSSVDATQFVSKLLPSIPSRIHSIKSVVTAIRPYDSRVTAIDRRRRSTAHRADGTRGGEVEVALIPSLAGGNEQPETIMSKQCKAGLRPICVNY